MKPAIPKGTRDFGPEAAKKRRYIFSTIESVFRKYGFEPIETPAMELLQTLTGKYGEEGDALLFKILNNGDFLQKADRQALDAGDSRALTPSIARRGLRYDLTVPFARFVAMNQHTLPFPFKRYQIQPVWRADRPQKGRYQEFFQCDADVIGSNSLIFEAELICIYDEVFTRLNLPVVIRINHRKVLQGLAEYAGIGNLFTAMTTSLDKLDKLDRHDVADDMIRRGIPVESAVKVLDLLETPHETIRSQLIGIPIAEEGMREIDNIFNFLEAGSQYQQIRFDFTLARGLTYYTGFVCEVTAQNMEFGSLGGGGRYADLTGVFGLQNMPGVGVSFGAERIYDVMEQLELFPPDASSGLQLILMPMVLEALPFAFKVAQQLRARGHCIEVYPEPAKMKKQMKYANERKAPYVGIIGSNELGQQSIMLKNMDSGEQEIKTEEALIQTFENYFG